MFVYLNNKIVPASEAKVSVFDHGFLYGDGIYETMRVYDGVIFMLDEHIKRLYRSASLIGLNIPKKIPDIKISIYETLKANSLTNAYVRLTISRGYGTIGLDPDLCKEPTFVVMTNEFKSYPRSYYKEGIKSIISSVRRNLKEAINPQIKSLNFLNNILAKIEAKQADVYEAIMLNAEGYLTEGTISNIFFVKDNILCTPSVECGILDGITRAIVIDLALKNGLEVKEGKFTPEELYMASEVFITNTTMEVMPVSSIVDRTMHNTACIAHKPVGEISKLLLKKYQQEVNGYVKEKKAEGPSLWE
ncbi:branched chain amino acid aminotransferase [Dissulfurispira thermophila]|uniref:Branched-chain-amino-acid aminotransferase n=1 Tax=Dissulfurispira thermophila TaxID=2715679 RepID=A0A7G1GXY2_9BACT|nr:branched-chain-amino-acid transaminase [Dissulfurispira thermophila]BCB95230.1 branched chain amino acid aminotransferase [Dissulfurispira thermophila]